VICAADGRMRPGSKPWTAVATRSSPCGAKNSNSTSPKIHCAPSCSESAVPTPASNFGAGSLDIRRRRRPPASGFRLPAFDFRSRHMPATGRLKIGSFLRSWLPLIAYCLAIYLQSEHPTPESIPKFAFSDKILHFAGYGLLGILFFRAYSTLPLGEQRNRLILMSIGSAALFGISDEIHQYFVPFRQTDIFDALADAFGSICGVYVFYRWKARNSPG
jgi:VanZ family protein